MVAPSTSDSEPALTVTAPASPLLVVAAVISGPVPDNMMLPAIVRSTSPPAPDPCVAVLI
jgi:hypothetical protein